ncbi:hypothetical protein Tco_0206820 [Tanacetum coccineum]
MCEISSENLVGERDKHIVSTLEFAREYPLKRIVNVNKLIEICYGPLIPIATMILKAKFKMKITSTLFMGAEMSFTMLVVHGVTNVWLAYQKNGCIHAIDSQECLRRGKLQASKAVDLDIDGPTSSQSKKISGSDGPTCSKSNKGSSHEAACSAIHKDNGKAPKTDDGVKKKKAPRKKVIVLG